MKTTLTTQLDPNMWLTVTQALKPTELGRLMKALAGLMNGNDPTALISTSALRLAFALLSEPLAESLERLERNRANGAKGGRPRASRDSDETNETDEGSASVLSKKSKKEELSPTPPKEEKIKKNIPVVDVDALTREQFKEEVLNNELRREQACASLHIDPGEYRTLVGEILNDWEFADEQDWSYKHLLNTLRIKVYNQSKPKYHENRSNTKRDITDTAATCAKDYEGPF